MIDFKSMRNLILLLSYLKLHLDSSGNDSLTHTHTIGRGFKLKVQTIKLFSTMAEASSTRMDDKIRIISGRTYDSANQSIFEEHTPIHGYISIHFVYDVEIFH